MKILLLLIFFPMASVFAKTHHVKPGDDLDALIPDKIAPGDTILFTPGTYTLNIAITERLKGPLTLKAGGKVRLKPKSLGEPVFYLEKQKDLTISGFEITGGKGKESCAIMCASDMENILISNNWIHGFTNMQHEGGIVFQNTYTKGHAKQIQILNNQIENFKVTNDIGAISIDGSAENVTIRGNIISRILPRKGRLHDKKVNCNASAIRIFGTKVTLPVRNITIESNTISKCAAAQSEVLVLNGNVDGFRVINNKITDVNNIAIDFIGGESDIFNPKLSVERIANSSLVTRNGLCSGNIISSARANYGDGYSSGIYVDGGKDIVIEKNTIRNSDIGIEIASETPGIAASGIIVRGNTIHHNRRAGIAVGGAKVNQRELPNGMGLAVGTQITNNLLYHNQEAGDFGESSFGEIWIQWARGTTISGNELISTHGGLIKNDGGNDLLTTFKGNRYFTKSEPIFESVDRTRSEGKGTYKVSKYYTRNFEQHRDATEPDARFEDPGFTRVPPSGKSTAPFVR